MKYYIDSEKQIIQILSSFTYEEFLVTFKKYEGYKISVVNNTVNYSFIHN